MATPPPMPPRKVSAQDLEDLRRAKGLLENPKLAIRLANTLGTPIEKGFQLLPKGWSEAVQSATRGALDKALRVAVASLGRPKPPRISEKFHKVLVGASGGLGGAFGLVSLPVELPVSTTFMLRSIADIARSEGHDLRDPAIRLACLEVFALGGPSKADNAAESGYWAIRAALAKAISEAATYVAERRVVEQTAPAMVRFVAAVAARFGVVVSEQVAAKAVPLVGAASGSIINIVFMDHFQDMARGHFIIKRLEAKYDPFTIKDLYIQLKADRAG